MKNNPGKILFGTVLTILIMVFFISGCGKNKSKYEILKTPFNVKDKFGTDREYKVFMPGSDKKVPLLVYFHGVMSDKFKNMPVLKGYTGSPVEETGLIPFCRANRIALLVIKPAYSYRFLNVESYGWSPFEKEINGIEKIIDIIMAKFNIDREEVYLSGISAGAVLSNHLANRRPELYNAILSHSQAYISEDNRLLEPAAEGPKFGLVIGYTKGDYKNLIDICTKSYEIYKKNGYKAVLLKDLPPLSHKWSDSSNRRFWRLLQKTGNGR
ncbi:MAG: PHB depolymerase family esterase [Acidobacteriota bacterium]